MIANIMMGVSEAMIYSHKSGLDIADMIELLSGGAAASFSLSNLAPRMLRWDFNPGFYAEHFLKDLNIATQEAKKMDIDLKGTELSRSLYKEHVENGGGWDGTQGILKTYEQKNHLEIPKSDMKQ